jgi:hypothetical protein
LAAEECHRPQQEAWAVEECHRAQQEVLAAEECHRAQQEAWAAEASHRPQQEALVVEASHRPQQEALVFLESPASVAAELPVAVQESRVVDRTPQVSRYSGSLFRQPLFLASCPVPGSVGVVQNTQQKQGIQTHSLRPVNGPFADYGTNPQALLH